MPTTIKTAAVMPHVPVSVGELLDKISILEIKAERIQDGQKRRHVVDQLEALEAVRRQLPAASGARDLYARLKQVNQQLWDIEDAIRDCERQGVFDDRFIGLARSVYLTNDRRAAIKRDLDELTGSCLVEEKSYADYQGTGESVPT